VERYGLARIAHHRDANKVAIADNSAAWVEINPAGSGQIDLSPGMGVAAAGLVIGDVQISRDEARGHPEGTGGIDHQHGKVATAPASECQSLERGLNALRANVDNIKLERGHGRDPSSVALISIQSVRQFMA
jgi:hypothetical protein